MKTLRNGIQFQSVITGFVINCPLPLSHKKYSPDQTGPYINTQKMLSLSLSPHKAYLLAEQGHQLHPQEVGNTRERHLLFASRDSSWMVQEEGSFKSQPRLESWRKGDDSKGSRGSKRTNRNIWMVQVPGEEGGPGASKPCPAADSLPMPRFGLPAGSPRWAPPPPPGTSAFLRQVQVLVSRVASWSWVFQAWGACTLDASLPGGRGARLGSG